MTINLHAAQSKQWQEMSKADKSRVNNQLPARFTSLREAMLMLHGEWRSLNDEIRSSHNREVNEAAVIARLLRTAAVCMKAACDLSSSKTKDKVEELLKAQPPPEFGYIPIVRPGDEDRRRKAQ